MRRRICFLFIAGIAAALVYLSIGTLGRRSSHRRRAELYLLDSIGYVVQHHLEAGGQLPTNWRSLSNSAEWTRVTDICEYNHLPPPTERYTVLAQAVTNRQTGGFCFLISSQPSRWPDRVGRWILVVGPKYTIGDWTSNSVTRTWLAETSLRPKSVPSLSPPKNGRSLEPNANSRLKGK